MLNCIAKKKKLTKIPISQPQQSNPSHNPRVHGPRYVKVNNTSPLSHVPSVPLIVTKKKTGGDITHQNGVGGESIYGTQFEDENFEKEHRGAGKVCMFDSFSRTSFSQHTCNWLPSSSPWQMQDPTPMVANFVCFLFLAGTMFLKRKILSLVITFTACPWLDTKFVELYWTHLQCTVLDMLFLERLQREWRCLRKLKIVAV